MINITKNIEENIYFTGSENTTITNPFYLFVFTHKITLEEIIFFANNISTNERVNIITEARLQGESEIPINEAFTNSTLGFWGYQIYQKVVDTDFTKSGLIIESGFMVLHPESVILPTEYTDQSNTFKIYNGE